MGDVSFFEKDLTRRTGRATAVVTSAQRPVPLTYRYALTPLHEGGPGLALQRRDLLRHRRLRVGQGLRGGREGTVLSHLPEDT